LTTNVLGIGGIAMGIVPYLWSRSRIPVVPRHRRQHKPLAGGGRGHRPRAAGQPARCLFGGVCRQPGIHQVSRRRLRRHNQPLAGGFT